MPCTHPLKGFQIGVNPETGKPLYKIVPYQTEYIRQEENGTWTPIFKKPDLVETRDIFGNGTGRYTRPYSGYHKYVMKSILVPCGKCIECRLRYSREWANRCMLELPYHEESWFVTLTYNDKNLPLKIQEVPDLETGEKKIICHPTLEKEALSGFMKRLRRQYEYTGNENKLRFFACGEYGGKTQRPHYHLIIFGLKLPKDDLTAVSNRGTYPLFSSKFIAKCWKYGFNTVGAVSWDTCAYVARYILKKQKGDARILYDLYGIQEEFTLMSRDPGIARKFYDEHKEDIYKFDTIWMKLKEKGYKCKPPKVFDRYFDVEEPDKMQVIRNHRKEVAEGQVRTILEKTKKSYLEYLADYESAKESKVKGLERRLENHA